MSEGTYRWARVTAYRLNRLFDARSRPWVAEDAAHWAAPDAFERIVELFRDAGSAAFIVLSPRADRRVGAA
jgi:hypothetical protein